MQFAVFCFSRCTNAKLEIGSPFAGNLVDPFDGRPPLPAECRQETDATRIPVAPLRSSGEWLVYARSENILARGERNKESYFSGDPETMTLRIHLRSSAL